MNSFLFTFQKYDILLCFATGILVYLQKKRMRVFLPTAVSGNFMKPKPSIIFLLFFFTNLTINSISQTIKADSINRFYIFNSDTVWIRHPFGKNFNFTGVYQVYRRQYYTIKTVESSLAFDSKNKLTQKNYTVYKLVTNDFPLEKGYYNKGKPSGEWEYYHDYGTDYSFCTQISIDYKVLYKKDSIIREKISANSSHRFATNKNVTVMKGFMTINEVRVNIDCNKSKNTCLVWTKYKSNIIKKFDFNIVEISKTTSELENGEYNRIIKNYH